MADFQYESPPLGAFWKVQLTRHDGLQQWQALGTDDRYYEQVRPTHYQELCCKFTIAPLTLKASLQGLNYGIAINRCDL